MGYTLQITSVITVEGMEFTARAIKFYGTEKMGAFPCSDGAIGLVQIKWV